MVARMGGGGERGGGEQERKRLDSIRSFCNHRSSGLFIENIGRGLPIGLRETPAAC